MLINTTPVSLFLFLNLKTVFNGDINIVQRCSTTISYRYWLACMAAIIIHESTSSFNCFGSFTMKQVMKYPLEISHFTVKVRGVNVCKCESPGVLLVCILN